MRGTGLRNPRRRAVAAPLAAAAGATERQPAGCVDPSRGASCAPPVVALAGSPSPAAAAGTARTGTGTLHSLRGLFGMTETLDSDAKIRASTILGAFEQAEIELVGKAVVLTNGKAGTVERVWLDESHGLVISIRGHDGKWPVSTVKFVQS